MNTLPEAEKFGRPFSLSLVLFLWFWWDISDLKEVCEYVTVFWFFFLDLSLNFLFPFQIHFSSHSHFPISLLSSFCSPPPYSHSPASSHSRFMFQFSPALHIILSNPYSCLAPSLSYHFICVSLCPWPSSLTLYMSNDSLPPPLPHYYYHDHSHPLQLFSS